MEYVQEIYFDKFIQRYIEDNGLDSFMTDDLLEMWSIYVNYYSHISTFKINPHYINNTEIKNEFIQYINQKRDNLL